ncbi:regulatory protein RecX [Thorsellia kenyensis]|uniref:Regulatory protein RecX n=1 Tax=Thorsellia kenyensis TaxID=1549888 RepID=A0ABV6CCS0_9GAMM
MNLSMKESLNFKTLLNLAQYYLAKRDHSSHELSIKLNKFCLLKNKSSHPIQNKNAKQFDEFTEDFSHTDYDFSSSNNQLSTQQIAIIDEVILYCEEHKWIDDVRFTRNYIATQHKKGTGKNKLKQNLYQKGINVALINQCLEESGIDWFELAKEIAYKKFISFNPKAPLDEKAKIARFLQSRGFSFDEINSLFE